MLSFKNRFHGRGGIRYVYMHGDAVRSRVLTCKHVANPRRTQPRIAVVISKKVLKSAVGRNRVRRRLYELMRRKINILPHGSDVVLIVGSPEIRTMPAEELETLLDQVLSEAGLNKTPEN